MPRLLYILRAPGQMMSSALYSPNDDAAITLGDSSAGDISHSENAAPSLGREGVQYEQLLDAVIMAEKVIVL